MNELKRRLSGLPPAQRSLLWNRMERPEGFGRKAAGIPRRMGDGPVPLSFAQESIWVHQQLDPSQPFYNRPLCLVLRGMLQVDALRRAVDLLLARHGALRCAVCDKEGQSRLETPPAGGLNLEWSDVSDTPDSVARAEAVLAEEVNRPVDVGRSPMFRGRLVRLATMEHWLILVFHHLIFDGESERIVLVELAELYRSVVSGTPPVLPSLPVDFADFAIWDRSPDRRAALSPGRAYWSEQLKSPPVLDLPAGSPAGIGNGILRNVRDGGVPQF